MWRGPEDPVSWGALEGVPPKGHTAMISTRSLLKDSLLAAGLLAGACGLFGGWMWLLAALGGAALTVGGLALTGKVTERALEKQVDGEGGGVALVFGLVLKMIVAAGLLLALLQVLPALPLLVGALSVVLGIAARSVVSSFFSPTGART